MGLTSIGITFLYKYMYKCMYVHKWKNHFVEMKGDVGMSVHEKGWKQENATLTHKTIYNPIPTSL